MTDSVALLFKEVSDWKRYRVNILVLCCTMEQYERWEKWKEKQFPLLHFSVFHNNFYECEVEHFDLILEIGDWMNPKVEKNIKDYNLIRDKLDTMEVVCEI